MDTNELPKEVAEAIEALALDAAACMAFLGIALANHVGVDRRALMADWRDSLPANREDELSGPVTALLVKLLASATAEMRPR